MIKVAVMGVFGRMGRSISSMLFSDDQIEIVGATEIIGHEIIGEDISKIIGCKEMGVQISDNVEEAAEKAEILVDFTNPETTISNIEYAGENNKAMVIGTTGFDKKQEKLLNQLAVEIPCVISPNMSVGINIMFEISKQVSGLLGDSYDVEIVEAHHKNKVDSPSGTAIGLGKAVAEGLGVNFEEKAVFERFGNIGQREEGSIGIQTLRGGDVVGDHSVFFLGDGERVELTHRASSRNNFSVGVLRAVKWLSGKERGIYSMKDVLGF